MSARYAPLPNPHTDPLLNHEMEAAFDDDDEEDDDEDDYGHDDPHAESRPLNPSSYSSSTSAPHPPSPATYDFENFDYASFPPPGSPPRPSSTALPNEIGNSNGLIPSPSDVRHIDAPRANWLRRTARAVLPNSYVQRFRLDYEPTGGVVGGGINNDGVFANVTAKPSRPVQIRDGDEVFLVPEESQKDAPPSYAAAQLDAVPPYWETTVHAPSSPDEMIIDNLPTGSVFSFLWNLLISISFQFVGFLLTYLLHTTHAARFGSRAGLGVTLIQYGFALRSRLEDDVNSGGWWGVGGPYNGGAQDDAPPRPTFETKEQAEEYYRNLNITMVDGMPSGTVPGATMDDVYAGDATTDWLSFFLMTIGWFILLTSLLSFWRVKRWERNILASQREPTVAASDAAGQSHLSSRLHAMVGAPIRDMGGLLRSGLGLARRPRADGAEDEDEDGGAVAVEVEEGRALPVSPDREATREMVIAMYAHDPERQRQVIQAFRDDDQLLADMRAAGML
ncbi:hypothetical protein BC834DRAFT_820327 [Gloeopeniophorella convolvens]|nr:hypothetical protein BC834DRAFT_820327 [Gloeopeniophorella convolvens]